jgi:nitric oxide reductase large subunit
MTNPAQRAYLRRFVPTMLAYVVAVTAVSAVMRSAHPPTGALAYALAVLPALPLLGVFWIIGRYLVEEQDEYVRMLRVRQTLIATGLTLSLATLWGFLETFANAPHVPLFYVSVLWFAGLGVGAFWIRLRP